MAGLTVGIVPVGGRGGRGAKCVDWYRLGCLELERFSIEFRK